MIPNNNNYYYYNNEIIRKKKEFYNLDGYYNFFFAKDVGKT